MLRASALACLASLTVAAPALSQTVHPLTPAVVFAVHDEPVDGLGDSFNASPFEGLIRTQSTRADRALQEYDVTALAGAPISAATLSGRVSVNNAFDNGVRTFEFGLYAANGVAELTDFQAPTVVVGNGQYHPPTQTFFDFSFDVTAALQALVASGATHVGLRVHGTSNPNFPNILSDTAALLEVTTAATIGASYCGPAVVNSSGAPAQIQAAGSVVAADNSVALTANALPANAFGFFLTSRAQGFVVGPGGSQGNLCLGGAIGRYVGPGQVLNSGAARAFTLPLDLTRTPTPSGLVTIQPGETWYFQAWFRDANPTVTSNLTDGLSITFS